MKILFVTIIAVVLTACGNTSPPKPVKTAPSNPVYLNSVEIPK